MPLKPGDKAPDFTLLDQNGEDVSLSSLRGRHVLVYFYPKADTPGCTKQACGLNEILGDIGDTAVIGISPDKPTKQLKFAEKYGLGFPLLSDPDHEVAEAFAVWKEKSMYGRKYMGIERSAFLIDPDGTVAEAWYKISAVDTPKNLLAALAAGVGYRVRRRSCPTGRRSSSSTRSLRSSPACRRLGGGG
jgi:thioredoxin-dependent peroxiredoxin